MLDVLVRDGLATLGNMRACVRSIAVSCWQCHHEAALSADRWPWRGPTFGPRKTDLTATASGRDANLAATAQPPADVLPASKGSPMRETQVRIARRGKSRVARRDR